jgi:predicted Rdx family selenoprotein
LFAGQVNLHLLSVLMQLPEQLGFLACAAWLHAGLLQSFVGSVQVKNFKPPTGGHSGAFGVSTGGHCLQQPEAENAKAKHNANVE